MPDKQFYDLVASLNQKQRHLFDFIFQWATNQRLSHDTATPFHIFLSGGAGVGKSHLVNAIYQGATRALRFPGQHPVQPTVLLTASTSKAAAGINGTTLHSAFSLPVREKRKKFDYKKSFAEKLNTLRSLYSNLKILIADEISMFGSLHHRHLSLQHIFQDYDSPFGNVSILAVGDLLQLNSVGDSPIFSAISGGYEALAGSLWTQYFYLYELPDIFRQKNDPLFADILSRVQTGDITNQDISALKELEHTDDSHFPENTIYIYVSNDQVNKYNLLRITPLENKVTIHCNDSRHDKLTNTVPVNITCDNIYKTGGLARELTIAIGANVMITKNVDIFDHLVNGVIGKISHIQINPQKPLDGTIYLQFNDDTIGRLAKQTCPTNLKGLVPIKATTVTFLLASECQVPVERTMSPLTLAFALTAHQSKGSTYPFCIADLQLPDTMKTVMPGQVYTILSHATSRSGLKLCNFSQNKIKVNTSALSEMKRLRTPRLFIWTHSLCPSTEQSTCVAFLNIHSLQAHLEDLVSHSVLENLSVLCLSETHLKSTLNKPTFHDFNTLYYDTDHGLSVFSKDYSLSTHYCEPPLQMMAITIKPPTDLQLFIAIVYRPPTMDKKNFATLLLNELTNINPTCSIVIAGDFNMTPYESFITQLCQQFNLQQTIQSPTHQLKTLDLIFVTRNLHTRQHILPVPYTDHFITALSFN